MRRFARETVFKLLFEYSFYHTRNDNTLDLMTVDSGLTDDDRTFIEKVYQGVIDEEEKLKDAISSKLETFKLERVYRPDLIVMMLAVYELYQKEVPSAVIINEAVELAKKFGTEKSGAFVNGVLGKIEKDLI